jgi:hypothetical protein
MRGVSPVWLAVAVGWLMAWWRWVRRRRPTLPLFVRCRNAEAIVEGYLRAVLASQRYDPVWVADLASTDDTAAILVRLQRYGGILLVHSGWRPPPGAALVCLEQGGARWGHAPHGSPPPSDDGRV